MRRLPVLTVAVLLAACDQPSPPAATTPAAVAPLAKAEPRTAPATAPGSAPASAPAAAPASSPDPTVKRELQHASVLCDGLYECYPKSGVYGAVAAQVIATVGERGVVKSTRVEGKDVPAKVRACLTKTISSRRLSPEVATPSEVTCEFSGGIGRENRTMKGRARVRHLPSAQ